MHVCIQNIYMCIKYVYTKTYKCNLLHLLSRIYIYMYVFIYLLTYHTEFISVPVYMSSGITTLHWTTNMRAYTWERLILLFQGVNGCLNS